MKQFSKIILALSVIASCTSYAQNSSDWETIDSLHVARISHAIVVLSNGSVLVSGSSIDSTSSSCEIFDIFQNKWRITTPMHVGRHRHNMILLKTGKVLAIGGYNERSCELFNPTDESWSYTDSIPTQRFYGQTVTELKDGKIAVCGGFRISSITGKSEFLSNCDIFDPILEKWSQITSLNIGRSNHVATLLTNGELLIAGGKTISGTLKSCEIFDPQNMIWREIDSMKEERSDAASILFPNGNVYVSGGYSITPDSYQLKKSCEMFDVSTQKWSYVQEMNDYRVYHKIFDLPNQNKYLIFGGAFTETMIDTWEVHSTSDMHLIMWGTIPYQKQFTDNAILLKDERLMMIGGYEYSNSSGGQSYWPSKSCEILSIITSRIKEEPIPQMISLSQNYPNPFNPFTQIKYSLKTSGYVKLEIFNTLGQKIDSLVDKYQNAGNYEILFDCSNLTSGTYFYRLQESEYSLVKKMTILK